MKLIKSLSNFNDIMTITTSDIKRSDKYDILRDLISNETINDKQLMKFISTYKKYTKFDVNEELLKKITQEQEDKQKQKQEQQEQKQEEPKTLIKKIKELDKYDDIMTIITSSIKRKFKEEIIREWIPKDILPDDKLITFINNNRNSTDFKINDELLTNITKINGHCKHIKGEKLIIDGITYYKYECNNKKGFKLIRRY